jgi:hypothetical protein
MGNRSSGPSESSGPSGPSGPSSSPPSDDQEQGLYDELFELNNNYDRADPSEKEKIKEKIKTTLLEAEKYTGNGPPSVEKNLALSELNRIKTKLGLSGGRRRNRTRGRKHRRNRRSSKNRR